eukprot:365289-Chlamydomonas_euryale.AAC.15
MCTWLAVLCVVGGSVFAVSGRQPGRALSRVGRRDGQEGGLAGRPSSEGLKKGQGKRGLCNQAAAATAAASTPVWLCGLPRAEGRVALVVEAAVGQLGCAEERPDVVV